MLHSKAEFSGGSSLSCSEATGATACTASCAKTDVSAIFPGGECAPAELYRLFFKCFKTHKTLLSEQWLGGCRVVPLSATCSQGRKNGADNVPDPPKPTFEWVSGVASLPQYDLFFPFRLSRTSPFVRNPEHRSSFKSRPGVRASFDESIGR